MAIEEDKSIYNIVTIKNVDDEDFVFSVDKVQYIIRTGETRNFPKFMARLAVKHLVDRILLKKDPDGALLGNTGERNKVSDEIVIGEDTYEKPRMPTDQEIVENINRPSDIDNALKGRKNKPTDELPDAKVYTQYVKKKREFRVNVFQDKVVNLREKVRQSKGDGGYIRNQENGYTTTHCRPMPDSLNARLKQLALDARKISKSDFVGVDIIYNEFYDKLYVLEVNSGPSIEGSSVNDFVKVILGN